MQIFNLNETSSLIWASFTFELTWCWLRLYADGSNGVFWPKLINISILSKSFLKVLVRSKLFAQKLLCFFSKLSVSFRILWKQIWCASFPNFFNFLQGNKPKYKETNPIKYLWWYRICVSSGSVFGVWNTVVVSVCSIPQDNLDCF